MLKKLSSGFTIKELAMVLVVIGILCIAVIPVYHLMRESHRETEFERAMSSLQSALSQWKNRPENKNLNGPESLDDLASGHFCNACFAKIIPTGLTSNLWYKKSDTEYLFAMSGKPKSVADFEKPGQMRVLYDHQTGKLLAKSNSSSQ